MAPLGTKQREKVWREQCWGEGQIGEGGGKNSNWTHCNRFIDRIPKRRRNQNRINIRQFQHKFIAFAHSLWRVGVRVYVLVLVNGFLSASWFQLKYRIICWLKKWFFMANCSMRWWCRGRTSTETTSATPNRHRSIYKIPPPRDPTTPPPIPFPNILTVCHCDLFNLLTLTSQLDDWKWPRSSCCLFFFGEV